MLELGRFEYDASAPLRVEPRGSEVRDGVAVEEIGYDDGMGGVASAYVVAPSDSRPTRGVVIAHGGLNPGKHKLLHEGVALARHGLLTLLPDTSMPDPGDAARDEQATVTAVIVQRRGLDVLASRGATSFGHFGHSFGGELSGILAAVEPRLAAIVIAATGTGLVEWLRSRGFADEEYLAAADRLNPIHYVRIRGERRLLFQYGRRDPVVSEQQARALFEAAAEPKRWLDYDWHHGVDASPEARADRFAFFDETL